MRLTAALGSLVVLACASSSVLAQSADGYVGVYRDGAGTSPCTNVPPFTGTTLYVLAKTAGQTANGITGAEFRVEVTNSTGWFVSFTPVTGASALMGNPIDTNPDPNQGGGINLSFASCQQPDANGIVRLGTLSVFNMNGSPAQLLVKRHSTPSNARFSCPLFVECDAPTYSKVCLSSVSPDTCSLRGQKASIAVAGDEPIFIATVNQQGQGSVPGAQDSLSSAARAMREEAIQRGLPEAYLSWRTADETMAWKQTAPDWMTKISPKILDRIRLLKEKNVLISDRRHLAAEYSTDLVPVDSLARLKVELKVNDTTAFDEQFFQGIGGRLVASAPRYGYLTAWVPPEQIQVLAERVGVKSINNLAARATDGQTLEGGTSRDCGEVQPGHPSWTVLRGLC